MKKLLPRKFWYFIILLCLFGYGSVFAQSVTGVVTDENNEPLPGVNVLIKGTMQGSITDIDGNYQITINDANTDVLVFSFLGFLTEEVNVNGKTKIDVQLIASIEQLEEVVVIGYGTMKKKDLSGSVASVSSEQLKDIPVSSVASAITGRLAGVQITTAEGSPDADVRIRVRGGGSITQDNSPLIIIDGFPANNITDIPPSDIESIDVLKDAASSSIYGARGANGVIIITTKKGTKNKIRVNYNFYSGIKTLAKKLDVLSPAEHVLYQYERALPNFLDRRSFEDLYGPWESLDSLYGNTAGTDWQQEVFGKKARTSYHNLSISGGSEAYNFNLSLTNNNEDGIMIGSGYKRSNANFKMEARPIELITVNLDMRYSDLNSTGSGTSDPGTSTTNNLKHSVIYKPVEPVGTSDELTDEDYWELSNLTNPLLLAQDDYREKNRVSTNLNAGVTIKPTKSFWFRTDFGVDRRGEIYDRFYGLSTSTARRYGDKPVVWKQNKNTQIIRWSNTLNYQLNAGNHNLKLLAGQEMILAKSNELENESRSFPEAITPEIAIGSIGLGEDPQKPSTYLSESKLLSFFGRANYIFAGKYIGSFTIRADGSSKFAPGKQWGIFPSGSFAWRISDEPFFSSVPLISNLKARVSYGQAGNNRIDDFLWTSTFRVGSSKQYYLLEQPYSYFYPDELANPNLKWETNISQNVGLDMGLFDSRLNTSIDIYKNKGVDLLMDSPIDPSSGYDTQMQNIAVTVNTGLELVLNGYIIDQKDFKLSANFNISFNKNKVEKIGYTDSRTYGSGWNNDIGDDYIVKVGESVGLMYGFVTDGFYTADDFEIDPATGEFLESESGGYVLKDGVANNEGIVFSGFGPGSYKFKDIGQPLDSLGNPINDGLVTFDDDRTVIGNASPKHIGGLNIMMNYKGIDLSVFLNWVYGNDVYNANKIEFTSGYRKYTNQLTLVDSDKRWTTINDQGELITNAEELAAANANAQIWKPTTGRYLFHSWAVEDGSFLRVNNVTLGYTLPNSLTSKFFVNKLRIYFTVNNLYTFTNYSGYDPEVDTRRATPLTPGVDYSAYPRSRSYLAGLNVTF